MIRAVSLVTIALAVCTSAGFVACSGSTTSTGSSGSSGTSPPVDGGTTPGTDGEAPIDAAPPSGGTSFSGNLGMLGAAKPTVSSVVISNSGETLIYMGTAPITCDTVKTSRWLGSLPAGSQVIEVVIRGAPAVGTVAVPPGEVNYAGGGKSSSYEVGADSGSIVFTKAVANGPVDGTLTAKYPNGDTLTGTFHAEFCAAGQGY